MKKYSAGDFRRPLTIQALTVTRDAQGGAVNTWNTFLKAHVMPVPLTGHEILAQQEQESKWTDRYIMRYPPNPALMPTAEMRILDGTRYLNIRSVIDLEERHQYLEIMAEFTGHAL